MPSWKKVVLHGSSGSLAHLTLENLKSQSVLGTDASGNIIAGSVSGYSLPTATDSILGGIKVGGTLSITNGVLSARTYTGAIAAVPGEVLGSNGIAGYVPAATAAQYNYFLRGDGSWAVPTNTVTRLRPNTASSYLAGDFMITGSGDTTVGYSSGVFTISSTDTVYTLSAATTSSLGGIKVGTNLSIDTNGVLSSTDTTYIAFRGANASTAGTLGLVPAPAKGTQASYYLRADGTWQVPPNTTYSAATTTANGLMSSTDKVKLNGIAAGAEVNVQADWNQTNTSAADYIKNKPTIPTGTGGGSIPVTQNDGGEVASLGDLASIEVLPGEQKALFTTKTGQIFAVQLAP